MGLIKSCASYCTLVDNITKTILMLKKGALMAKGGHKEHLQAGTSSFGGLVIVGYGVR